MKWMGWSCADLDDCWADLVPVILEVMREEAEAERRASRAR